MYGLSKGLLPYTTVIWKETQVSNKHIILEITPDTHNKEKKHCKKKASNYFQKMFLNTITFMLKELLHFKLLNQKELFFKWKHKTKLTEVKYLLLQHNVKSVNINTCKP